MNGSLVRTTITMPSDLYEKLRERAFYQRESLSSLIRKSVDKSVLKIPHKRERPSFFSFIGKFSLKQKGKKWRDFDRAKFYDDALKRKMSFGY